MILPDLVESDEETDSESEAEQEYIMDATRDIYDATRDTYDFLEGEKQNIFQPSGRTRSCMGMTKAEYIDSEYIHNYDEAPNKISGKHHEEGTKENCTVDLYEKKAVENHRVAFPEPTDSEDEVISESEIEQEDSIETASHRTWDRMIAQKRKTEHFPTLRKSKLLHEKR